MSFGESKTVTLISNTCLDSFPSNKNFDFANPLPDPVNLSSYEVALTSVTYYDRYVKPEPTAETTQKPKKQKNFFNIQRGDHRVSVEKQQLDQIRVEKTDNDILNVLGSLTDALVKEKFPVTFEPEFRRGILSNIVLTARLQPGYRVILSESFATILGFSSNSFQSGEFTSQSPPNITTFSSVPLHSEIGTITVSYLALEEISLDQVEGLPTLSSLLADIVATLAKAKFNVSLKLKKNIKTVEYNTGSIRFRLSQFLNEYLGLYKSFIFQDRGSFVVTDSIIKPSDTEPSASPKKQVVTCSKVIITLDVIEDQIYAGRKEKVLAILERTENKSFQRHTIQPDILIYKQVEKDFVTHLRIGVRSDQNTFLESCQDPTVVTLHFRKKLFE